MYGLACDDSHDYHGLPNREANPGRGWVEVLAKELTPAALIAALDSGQFYASSGVRLKDRGHAGPDGDHEQHRCAGEQHTQAAVDGLKFHQHRPNVQRASSAAYAGRPREKQWSRRERREHAPRGNRATALSPFQ